MDPLSSGAAMQAAATGSDVGTALLKKSNDQAESQATELVSAIPSPAGVGSKFDASA